MIGAIPVLRAGVCVAGALTAAAFVVATAQAELERAAISASTSISAGAPRLVLHYEAYRIGIHVVDTRLDLEFSPDRYELIARFETIGIARWFMPWRSTSSTEGAVTPAGLVPRRHRLAGEWSGSARRVAIDYAEGEVEASAHPSAAEEKREPVPNFLRRATVDPSSAVLTILQRVSAGGSCEGTYPVFDGRRRFDLVVSDRGQGAVAVTQGEVFSGETLACDFTIRPIAGYAKLDEPGNDGWRKARNGRAWLGRVAPGTPLAPVRVEIESKWGDTIIVLKQANVRLAGKSSGTGPDPTP